METIVVTASRREQTLGSISASVEVIDQTTLDNTSSYVVTDLLKKNASVDVIQYPGGTAGVGIRGFRPQFSGVNQRVLVLVDGRPAGATSMNNIARAGIQRVEVVKGSASSIYGPSAMGGVVNYITRRSEGEIQGNVDIGLGSYDAMRFGAELGGAVGERFSFDLGLSRVELDDDYELGEGGQSYGDFTQGNGAVRQHTTYQHNAYFARGSVRLTTNWEAQLRVFAFDEPRTETPGAESDGTNDQGARKGENLQQELSFFGDVDNHSLLAIVYATQEDQDTFDESPPSEAYLSFERDTDFTGVQIQDTWALSDSLNLVLGIDHGFAESQSRSYLTGGVPRAPFSPNFERENAGIFADLTADWLDGRLTFNVGTRYDEIESRVLATPLRDDIAPGTSAFDTVNPRAGIVFRPRPGGPLRIHASAGTGFIAPEANQVAGLTETVVGTQTRITVGNPDLEPEESLSIDIGVGYDAENFGFDVTYFDLEVDSRIESIITTNTDTLRETTYVNAQGSKATGLEAQVNYDIGALTGGRAGVWSGSFSATRYFDREQELASGFEPLRNVARSKVNFDFRYQGERFGARLNGRHVDGMMDSDFSAARIFTGGAGGTYEYPSFLVFDASMYWKVTDRQQVNMQIDNLRDDYYFEKGDYPLPGRGYHVSFRQSF